MLKFLAETNAVNGGSIRFYVLKKEYKNTIKEFILKILIN